MIRMSKVQSSDNSLTDIANATLANQLESRLKELERNIAVARQFIGMADECYSKVKHEFELLQQDIGVKNATVRLAQHFPALEEKAEGSKPERETIRTGRKNKSESLEKKGDESFSIPIGSEDSGSKKKARNSRSMPETSLKSSKGARSKS